MYKRKYKNGKKIVSISALKHFLDKDNFIYINNKILHKDWVLSLQFRYLIYAIDRGQITRAIKIPGNHLNHTEKDHEKNRN